MTDTIAFEQIAQDREELGETIVHVLATGISPVNSAMYQAGQAANQAAAGAAFADHIENKASNTERRKRADLALFETYLNDCHVPAAGMYEDPEAWRGVTWGLVKGFIKWQLNKGYAIGSINGRLSTVRTFAALAMQAGAVTAEEGALIASVKGYSRKESIHVDERRRAEGKQIRTGAKKTEAVTIPDDIAQALKQQPDTPQGRRDTLLMCLLIDHGFRVSEVAILTRQSFDLKRGEVIVYRPKVAGTETELQTHTLSPETRKAAAAYLEHDAPADGIIWRKSCKGTGKLSSQLSETSATRAINKRVELLGRHAGIDGLSPHDCRHYAATWEARQEGAKIDKIKYQFGWNSYAMAGRYIKAAQIANDGSARLKNL